MILVVSWFIDGCWCFNEIYVGVLGMLFLFLFKCFCEFQDVGLVCKIFEGGCQMSYELIELGREVEVIVMLMVVWGQQWVCDMEMVDFDLEFLVWSLYMGIDVDLLFVGCFVLEFEFLGCVYDCDCFWLVCEDWVVEMCVKDFGFDVDVIV